MSSELCLVDFHGDKISAMQDDQGRVLTSLRHLCRILELDYDQQVAKLRGRSWAYVTTMKTPTVGGWQPTTMIDLRTLHGWLFTIDERKVRESMRPTLVRYQTECVGVLERHFGNRPLAEPDRHWASRWRESFAPHSQHVLTNHPPGSFTVITEGVMTILMLEDELLRHMMEVRPGDRPCISIGLTWANHRRLAMGRLDNDPNPPTSPIWLPDRKLEVPARVYPAFELHLFKTWLHFVYLPNKLQKYLDGKPEFREHGGLPRASVADNTCRTITGRRANLTTTQRSQIIACNGFAPALPAKPGSHRLGK